MIWVNLPDEDEEIVDSVAANASQCNCVTGC